MCLILTVDFGCLDPRGGFSAERSHSPASSQLPDPVQASGRAALMFFKVKSLFLSEQSGGLEESAASSVHEAIE